MPSNGPDKASSPLADPLMKPMLDRLQEKCSFPKASELKENVICTVCQDPFLSENAPEIPVRLPCGHIMGLSCLLQWLSPLSTERRRDTCPLCRRPVLGALKEHERRLEVMRRYLPEFDAYPENPDRLERMKDDAHVAWISRAEELWTNLCEELLILLEEMQLPNEWLRAGVPLVKIIINFASVGNFVIAWAKASRFRQTREAWWVIELNRNCRRPFLALVNHVHSHIVGTDIWSRKMESVFPSPTEADFLRVAGYHRRIRESHARLSYRIHAYLEPAEV